MGKPTRLPGFLAVPLASTLLLSSWGCGGPDTDPTTGGAEFDLTSSEVRAARRQYDGAPPIVPHEELGTACETCHDGDGLGVEGIGFAPASPHSGTGEESATWRCRQCHVPALTDDLARIEQEAGITPARCRAFEMALAWE